MAKVFRVPVFISLDSVEDGGRTPTKKDAKEIVRVAMQMLYSEGYEDPNITFDFDLGDAEFKGEVDQYSERQNAAKLFKDT